MCQRARDWAIARIPAEQLETMACQDTARPVRAPMVATEDCMEAMQLLLPDGRLYAGEKAFAPLLRLTPGGQWYAWCFYLPGVSLIYRTIARNRLAISALLFRKKPGAHCSIDKGCD